MATNTLPETIELDLQGRTTVGLGHPLRPLLAPLASLKITVVTFVLAIFLTFAGTLAQIDHDIWQVMGEYFRTPLAWIPFQIFVPRSIALPGGFYFPGGFTIGTVMLVNLFAAHALRFKVQARGMRLFGGLALATVGVLMTWLVIVSGSNKDGVEGEPLVDYSTLWQICKWGVVAAWLAVLAALASTFSVGDERPRSVKRWTSAAGALVLGLLAGVLLYLGDDAELSGPSMRILWQLMKGGFAGLVLLVGCVMLFHKRAGIVLLHAGVGLMMINELVVYALHTEGQMQIHEGETVNYAQDIRSLELAVVDPSDAEHDEVVVVPQSALLQAKDRVVKHAELPFDIQVVKFLQNTRLRQVKKDEQNSADAGQGLSYIVEEARSSSGTDMGGGVDLSAAYVKFIDKQSGKSLGTHLLALYPMFEGEHVKLGDKTYNVALRFKRDYKPYAVHLIDVRFDKYMGTSTAKNYSSDVRLVDPSRHVDRKVKIWMNNPLRYAGETLYQSTFNVDPVSRKEMTGLQVVTNTGWMIPYVACMIVATGMLAHFCVVLVRFLRRQSESVPVAPGNPSAKRRRRREQMAGQGPAGRWAVSALATLSAAWLLSTPGNDLNLSSLWMGGGSSSAKPSDKLRLDDFGRLPVVYEGRVKPFDTLARNSLQVISNRDYLVDLKGKKQPAIRWLLDVIVDAPEAKKHQVVKIDSPDVQQTFELPKDRRHFRYSIEELLPKYDEFQKQTELAYEVDAHARNGYQQKIIELDRRLRQFSVLRAAFEPPPLTPDSTPQQFLEAMRRQKEMMDKVPLPLPIPPARDEGEWQPYPFAWAVALAKVHMMGQEADQTVIDFSSIITAYGKGDATEFNRAVARYDSLLQKSRPPNLDQTKVRYEQLFNRLNLFSNCGALYLAAFLLAAGAWLGWRVPLNRAAFWLVLLTLVIHTRALEGRIYISGRPPVTNLYSAAVFIGWGAVILGLTLEWFFSLGIGNVIASVAGFTTLLIAGLLGKDGDTFTVLQAVLDTQFWLATHVVCISLGYATTFVAGLLGLIYVLGGVFSRALTADLRRELSRMIYGVLCFAIFFSFVGTVLGGLWADDSWGRFWGWDPKENGALIIVLWNALVLHARWDGMVKDRGLAVLAIGGNIAVGWSMFGVNELGAGLHSYGFTNGVAQALAGFVVLQIALIALGSLPIRFWRSRQTLPA